MKKNGKLVTVNEKGIELNNVELLEQLHGVITLNLINLVNSGKATAQDYSNAIRLLKDNGVTTMLDMEEIKEDGMKEVLNKLRMDVKEEEKNIKSSDIIINKGK